MQIRLSSEAAAAARQAPGSRDTSIGEQRDLGIAQQFNFAHQSVAAAVVPFAA